jgi:hypothetical protein
MSTTFRIPYAPGASNPLVFPERCLSCGAPKEAESTLALSRNVMRGQRQESVTLNLPIPHCARCARTTKNVFLAGCIPFALGFVVAGLAAFLAVFIGAIGLGLDEGPTQAGTPLPSWVLGGLAGLLAGFAGGFVFELAARVVLIPFFGRALLGAPLLAAQFIRDSDYVAGVTGALSADGAHIQLEFSNDEVAREFARLNAAVIKEA